MWNWSKIWFSVRKCRKPWWFTLKPYIIALWQAVPRLGKCWYLCFLLGKVQRRYESNFFFIANLCASAMAKKIRQYAKFDQNMIFRSENTQNLDDLRWKPCHSAVMHGSIEIIKVFRIVHLKKLHFGQISHISVFFCHSGCL